MNTTSLTLSDRAINVARSQVGFQEEPVGSNWGKHVQKYLKSVGITFPAAWCMAFVYWCFTEAARESGQTCDLVKTGGVLDQWNRISPRYKATTPKRGDIFIMDYGKGKGHTGIVEKAEGGIVWTIEGNTNDDGSREGYEVCRRQRPANKIVGYIRL